MITRFSVSVTDCDGRLFATFKAKHSRVKLSMTVSTRILLPSEEGLLANPKLPAELRNRQSVLDLLQGQCDLLI
jgi:hypothetical protein